MKQKFALLLALLLLGTGMYACDKPPQEEPPAAETTVPETEAPAPDTPLVINGQTA